jgi:hypothetical protein
MQRTSIEPGTVAQVLADIAPAAVQPDVVLIAARDAEDALDLLGAATADRRVLLDLSGLQ